MTYIAYLVYSSREFSLRFLTALLGANIKTAFVANFDALFGEIADISHHQHIRYRHDKLRFSHHKDQYNDNPAKALNHNLVQIFFLSKNPDYHE